MEMICIINISNSIRTPKQKQHHLIFKNVMKIPKLIFTWNLELPLNLELFPNTEAENLNTHTPNFKICTHSSVIFYTT